MKTKLLLSMFAMVCFYTITVAQTNIFPSTGAAGIGTTSPNASSLLEVKSTTKGILIPRMTQTQRDAITSPATGLLIYQTNTTPGFYYYDGSAWIAVSGANTSLSNLSATAINTNLLPDNNSRNFGSAGKSWKNIYFKGSIYQGSKRVLYADSTGNYFAGLNTGPTTTTAIWNTAIGNNTFLANTTGESNTAVGYAALQTNTTGSQNTALGFGALNANTIGGLNTAIGTYALTYNTSGGSNVATGYEALELNTTGYNNTANGFKALQSNTTGTFNTAVGFFSLINNTTGADNTALGDEALDSLTTGNHNVAIGENAGDNLKTGSYNVAIGSNATFVNSDVQNTIAIGSGSGYFNSNTGSFGNSSITGLYAQVGWSQYSDGRVKDNIKSNVPGLAFINKLNPVTYNFNIHRENAMLNKSKLAEKDWAGKYDIEKKKMTGFVAQEVEKAANDIGYDFSGVTKPNSPNELYALNYSEFVVPLVKAVQELSKMNDAKDSEINNLEARLSKLEAMMNAQTSSSVTSNATINNSNTGFQVSPNPFSNATTIQYTLLQHFSSAKIIITDNNGKAITGKILPASSKGSVNINASNLSSGIYNCMLYVDGKMLANKQIIKSN